MKKKKNIFLIGSMGSGKSTIGFQLSTTLNMNFYDSDKEIEKKIGLNINEIFNLKGELKFRIYEEKIISELTNKTGIVLATGGGSIMSEQNRLLLSSRGVIVYLRVTVSEQLNRIYLDHNRPLLSGDYKTDKEMLSTLLKLRDPLYTDISDIIINTGNDSISLIVSNIIDNIKVF